jgi:hypothetical protein
MGAFDQIDPRYVRVSFYDGTAVTAAGATRAAPAPGTAVAAMRYLLGFSIGDRSLAGVELVTVEDQNGNVLGGDPAARTPPGFCMLNVPIPVGLPNANALQIRNRGTVGENLSFVLWFADLPLALSAEIFRS